MRNFKQLKIWQKGMDIAVKCITITNTFPKQERFGLVSQLNRACISIPSNISESSSRSSSKDYNRFIEISIGSCFEAETQFLIALQLGFGDQNLIKEILILLTEEQKMLSSFSNKLKACSL